MNKIYHVIFGVVCVVWVIGHYAFVLFVYPEWIEQDGEYYWQGRAIGSLWLPGMVYATILFFDKRRKKKLTNP